MNATAVQPLALLLHRFWYRSTMFSL